MKYRHAALLSIINYSLYIGAATIDPPVFSEPHGYKQEAFTLELTSPTEGAAIYYTTDCTTPSAINGTRYTKPFTVSRNATLRAIAIDPSGEASTTVAATYLFMKDVLSQSNTPKGYPSEWGPYASIQGTAPADYEMDPEMTSVPATADSIRHGLMSLPTLSVITEPGFLFSHEKDDSLGGIYIYTGGDASSTGNGYGDGWLRAASVEFWENEGSAYNNPDDEGLPKGFQVNCAIKIHGNASRMAEKTPKHSLRMKMKSSYGPKKLQYRMFGKHGGKKFNQLVIRAGFGNSWLHWLTGQQRQGMFTRDAWAKRMMRDMGHLSAGTRFAHLYLNGMYWGMYNPTERIDADFCELHLGGKADDYDVVRFDDGKLNTVDGELDAYERMYEAVKECGNYANYQALRGLDVKGDSLDGGEVLLDPDNFIDFMLVNYYGGNGDWDHHNWVAVRSRVANEGFSWLPWDSELVLQNVNDNVTNVYNSRCPTAIFKKLMDGSPAFRMSFADHAHRALCEPFGILTPDSARQVWETLNQEINDGVWAEAARWGDYRRDVHPYTSRGDLYTKLTYDAQCQKMRTGYFPKRTGIVLSQFKNAGWWCEVENVPALNIDGQELEVENAVVESTQKITMRGSGITYYTMDGKDPMSYNSKGNPTRSTSSKRYSSPLYLEHDCTIKMRTYVSGTGWGPLRERHFTVLQPDAIATPMPATVYDDRYYDLQGRPVTRPAHGGIYIHHGRKVIIK